MGRLVGSARRKINQLDFRLTINRRISCREWIQRVRGRSRKSVRLIAQVATAVVRSESRTGLYWVTRKLDREVFDAVLIDFYGTISAGDRAAVDAACTRIVEACDIPLSPAEFAVAWGQRFFDTIARSNHDSFQKLVSCELSSLRDTFAAMRITADPEPFVQELEAYWSDPPIHADAIDFLSRVQLPVCCVSNADTQPLRAAIDRHQLRFDAVVTSEEVRCYKPNAKVFHVALERLGVRPERALHVGDSRHSDVSGAIGVGLTAVWLKRDSRIHDIGVAVPDFTISSLTGMFDLLCR